jgi:Ni/Co efflux regulator RcnB
MKKILIMIVLATAMLTASAGNAFAFDGRRGEWDHRDFDRDYHRDFHRREIVVVERRPCREPVVVYPPRVAIVIGSFAIIGF